VKNEKFDLIVWLAVIVLVMFWGLILGFLVGEILPDGFIHKVDRLIANALRAAGGYENGSD